MPFKQVSIDEKIKKKTALDPLFKEMWDESRNEYALLHDIVRLRKELNLTQKELAEISETSQQEISRMEKRHHSPALKTLCKIVNSMGYELILQKKVL